MPRGLPGPPETHGSLGFCAPGRRSRLPPRGVVPVAVEGGTTPRRPTTREWPRTGGPASPRPTPPGRPRGRRPLVVAVLLPKVLSRRPEGPRPLGVTPTG